MATAGWQGAGRKAPRAAALALLATIPLLAGCVQDPAIPLLPAPSPFAIQAFQAQPGRSYAIDHPGGTLTLRIAAASAGALVLYDGEDRRLGAYSLGGGGAADLRIDELAPGRHVLQVVGLNGTLMVEGPAGPVPLWPLRTHVERHVLASRPAQPVPPIPLVPRDTIHDAVRLDLTHPPTGLVLYADGDFGDLHLELSSPAGEVFRSDWGGAKFDPPFYEQLEPVPGTFHSENVRSPSLEGRLDVEDLQGVLLLDATSYSRALPAGQELVSKGPSTVSVGYRQYGLLPPRPVAFHVSSQATHLAFWNDGALPSSSLRAPDPSWVAIYDAKDRKLASVPVLPGTVTTLQVEAAGEYVAVLLSGNATLGADAAPPELGLKPLDTLTQVVPQRPAGKGGEYGQANETIAPQGVLYGIGPTEIMDALAFPQPQFVCLPEPSLRILQGGEVLAAWGPQWQPEGGPVGVLLDGSETTLWHDGFGPSDCPRLGAKLLSYVR